MILLDTSELLAAIDSAQEDHVSARQALAAASQPRILSPFILAELDYLLVARVGQDAEVALLDEVARGVYRLDILASGDVCSAHEVITRYADLGLGLADASIVVLAHRYGCHDVLTWMSVTSGSFLDQSDSLSGSSRTIPNSGPKHRRSGCFAVSADS